MATLLARLGRASYRHRAVVSLIWLAVLAATVTFLVTVGGSFDDRFTIPGSESQEALDHLRDQPRRPRGARAGRLRRDPRAARPGQRRRPPGQHGRRRGRRAAGGRRG